VCGSQSRAWHINVACNEDQRFQDRMSQLDAESGRRGLPEDSRDKTVDPVRWVDGYGRDPRWVGELVVDV
jgi:hypothetical protein